MPIPFLRATDISPIALLSDNVLGGWQRDSGGNVAMEAMQELFSSDAQPKKGRSRQNEVPIIHNHLHSINNSVTAEQAAEDYEFVIRKLVRTRVINVSEVFDCPKLDLVLPWNVRYKRELWVTYITDFPKPPPERITFTLPVINSASNVAVVVTGVGKAEAVHLALDNIGPESPARMVSPINGKLVWFHDITAASKLEGIKFSEWS